MHNCHVEGQIDIFDLTCKWIHHEHCYSLLLPAVSTSLVPVIRKLMMLTSFCNPNGTTLSNIDIKSMPPGTSEEVSHTAETNYNSFTISQDREHSLNDWTFGSRPVGPCWPNYLVDITRTWSCSCCSTHSWLLWRCLNSTRVNGRWSRGQDGNVNRSPGS